VLDRAVDTVSRVNPTLVACSHGTADVAGSAAVTRLVDAVRADAGFPVVEAFVDVHGPFVADVVAAADGHAVVVPLLLAAGYHVRVDVAAAVAPWTGSQATCALGPDVRLTAVLLDRMAAAGVSADDAVVLVAAGSSDDAADASVRAAAEQLSAAWGAPVTVAYGASRAPGIADEVARLRSSGRRVALVSYLLATGHFHRKVLAAGADVVTAPLLDDDAPDPRLVDLVRGRYLSCVEQSCCARTAATCAAVPLCRSS
jgi:sirohydrochlorin ferrochelatase